MHLTSSSFIHVLVLIWVLLSFACQSNKQPEKYTESIELEHAVNYFNKNNMDTAYKLFAHLITSEKVDSLELAKSLIYMGIIHFQNGDYYGSQEVHLKALSYLNTENPQHKKSLFSVNHELGNTLLNLKYYDQAIDYYERGLEMLPDENYRRHILNNIAIAYFRSGNYKKAIQIYQQTLSTSFESPQEYARHLSNYHRALWYENDSYNPLTYYWEALAIRKEKKDFWGLNASYAHLTDYYTSNMKFDSANYYADQMIEVANVIQSTADQIDALKKKININRFQKENDLLNRYIQLNDSLINARTLATNQYTLIRYETEKSKADNLLLEKENRDAKLLAISLIALIIVLIIFSILYIQLIRKNNDIKLNESKLNISQKVHDVVANGLYDLISKVDHDVVNDKEILLDHLEHLYNQSRDISYENTMSPSSINTNLISSVIKNYASFDRKINVVGNVNEVINHLDARTQDELLLIIKELLINMKKHSQAQNVSFKFEHDAESIIINYVDDGIGLKENYSKGNGMKNVENRINKLDGKINFEKSSSGGLAIRIKVPNN